MSVRNSWIKRITVRQVGLGVGLFMGGALMLTGCADETGGGTKAIPKGKVQYQGNCQRCHGANGDLGFQGAKALSVSKIPKDEVISIVKNGKGLMPANPGLSDQQI
ncbi:MAG: cytochrome c, partial [Bacteroidota bacterium]